MTLYVATTLHCKEFSFSLKKKKKKMSIAKVIFLHKYKQDNWDIWQCSQWQPCFHFVFQNNKNKFSLYI